MYKIPLYFTKYFLCVIIFINILIYATILIKNKYYYLTFLYILFLMSLIEQCFSFKSLIPLKT